MNKNKIIIYICLIGAVVCFYLSNPNVKMFEWSAEKLNPIKEDDVQPVNERPESYDVSVDYKNLEEVFINVNYPPSLSYKSKNEIYKMRKQYVSESIFNNSDYELSDAVFGQIENKKPWMTINPCEKPEESQHGITGPSEEGRWIANPAMLVAVEYPFFLSNDHDYNWCNSEEASLIPKKITYTPKDNIITVVYRSLPIVIQNNSFYTFNGVNARDFGYKYAYLDKNKSTYKLDFLSSDNISNEVITFQNFIHLGSSCGHAGGCNNGSPRQPKLEFTYKSDKYTHKNAVIYLKLWKKQPQSVNEPADIIEKIIF